ncbi:MAG: ParA family protein [Bauldia sp.]
MLAIANLKGGVGKTTVAANIGAYYAKDWEKRVLLVDLDYQGSLSSMSFPTEQWAPSASQSSLATQIVSNDIAPYLVPSLARPVALGENYDGKGSLSVITAYYDLAQADNRLLVEWLLKCKPRRQRTLRRRLIELFSGRSIPADVRYTLAEVLHSQAVRDAYDVVIIDCPPRLTTSEMQAFCAATHILIPTILDRTSADAVGSLCLQIETLKSAGICPHLTYAGVVGTKWNAQHNVGQRALRQLRDRLNDIRAKIDILPHETFVPMTVQIVNNADEGIAYLVMPQSERQKVRAAIESLAIEVAARMGLVPPLSDQAPAGRRVHG